MMVATAKKQSKTQEHEDKEEITPEELNTWNIVECKFCGSSINICTCRWIDGDIVCPDCKRLN
jgi:hypothetical protein